MQALHPQVMMTWTELKRKYGKKEANIKKSALVKADRVVQFLNFKCTVYFVSWAVCFPTIVPCACLA
jgi:hypothetical protein